MSFAIDVLKTQLEKLEAERKETMKKIEEEYNPKILDLQSKITMLLLICPVCDGEGTERYCDAAGDMDDRSCSNCKGTGKIGY